MEFSIKLFYQWVRNDSQICKATTFERASVLKIIIFPSNETILLFRKWSNYCILLTVFRTLVCNLKTLLYEKWKTNVLIVSVVRLLDFKPQTVSKTPFRKASLAISHFLKSAFSLEKQKNTLKVFIKFLTDNKSLRKNVESSA